MLGFFHLSPYYLPTPCSGQYDLGAEFQMHLIALCGQLPVEVSFPTCY